MSDHGFGEILDAWENNLHKKVVKKPETSFEKMLDRYTPEPKILQDKDTEHEVPTQHPHWKDLPVEAQIDLHGLTTLQAESAILSLVQTCKQTRKRKLLIIHGKGNHSPDGKSKLKIWLQDFLDRQPWAGPRGTAEKRHGASGATWVIIR